MHIKRLLFIITLCVTTLSHAAIWSFSGGYVYFDNSQTRWTKNIYLIIGKSTYSSVYPMTMDSEDTTHYVASLHSIGWSDAEYMAVISHSDWKNGHFGYDELKNASGYTAAYTSGLTATADQRFLFTPVSGNNGTKMSVTWLGDNMPVNFAVSEKNNCQKLYADKGLVTVIFSTSSKHFNVPVDDIEHVFLNGSVSIWNDRDPHYVLPVRSSDDCFFGTFPLRDLQRCGNSGQPEFVFHVVKKDGTDYTTKASATWHGAMDSRLLFVNNGTNMLLLLPGDDIAEIGRRGDTAKYIAPLSYFNLSDSADIAHLTNFRRVPATRYLYRSYHPFNPDRPQYDTEHERMVQLATLGAQYGIKSDIALSGDQTDKVGNQYTCGGQQYTITIPAYYQDIIDNNNVLYVGTANGHIPSYHDAVFRTNEEKFGQWMQEVVRFINSHPAPFQIHCSLGADRTGAFSATLAALCGASWSQIAQDYHMTSNLRIQEYRHANCVRYELYLLTGEWPEVFAPVSAQTGRTLAQAVAQHFIDGGYLTQEEIDACVRKLTASSTPTGLSEQQMTNQVTKQLYNGHLYIYDPLSRRTFSAMGTYIDGGASQL